MGKVALERSFWACSTELEREFTSYMLDKTFHGEVKSKADSFT